MAEIKQKTKKKQKTQKTSTSEHKLKPKAKAASTHHASHSSIANHKTIKIKHHHKKPYRKRHYLSLLIILAAATTLLAFVVGYNVKQNNSLTLAHNFFQSTYGERNISSHRTIESTYNFSVTYNSNKYYAGAVDTNTGNLYTDNQLDVRRAYSSIRISTSDTKKLEISTHPHMEVNYYPSKQFDNDSASINNIESTLAVPSLLVDQTKLTKKSSSSVSLDGHNFQKSVWQIQTQPMGIDIPATYITYSGVINGSPFVITVSNGSFYSDSNWYEPIINSINFSQANHQVGVLGSATALSTSAAAAKLNDFFRLGLTKISPPSKPSTSERVSATYTPAVVKIYNVYCMDITIEGSLAVKDACQGISGSGFFVSGNGYIATNGHVATSSPKDIAITFAVQQANRGNKQPLLYLIELTGLKKADVAGLSDDAMWRVIFDRLNSLPDSKFKATNYVRNLLVCLNSTQPDVDELLKLTENNESYPTQKAIKHAKLVATNYHAVDPYFTYSDIALIKIDGSNYPVTTLGSIDSVSSGENINIFGFPGNASGANGLVSSDNDSVTLTTGSVSGIKKDKGGKHKLIETDTTIGHGNSGGPAINDQGDVVGISTYTADGSGSGNGTYNYIRDIGDLKKLASKNNIDIGGTDETQQEWVKGINLFYQAHFSEALGHFETVKKLYPQSPSTDKLISQSKKYIEAGYDVKSFPTLMVIVAAVVLAVLGAGVVFIIIRHRKAHSVYKAHVASGAMQPVPPGAPAQTVSYNPAAVQSANNPLVSPPAEAVGQAQPNPATPASPMPPPPTQQPPVQPVQPSPQPPAQPAQPPTQPPSNDQPPTNQQ